MYVDTSQHSTDLVDDYTLDSRNYDDDDDVPPITDLPPLGRRGTGGGSASMQPTSMSGRNRNSYHTSDFTNSSNGSGHESSYHHQNDLDESERSKVSIAGPFQSPAGSSGGKQKVQVPGTPQQNSNPLLYPRMEIHNEDEEEQEQQQQPLPSAMAKTMKISTQDLLADDDEGDGKDVYADNGNNDDFYNQNNNQNVEYGVPYHHDDDGPYAHPDAIDNINADSGHTSVGTASILGPFVSPSAVARRYVAAPRTPQQTSNPLLYPANLEVHGLLDESENDDIDVDVVNGPEPVVEQKEINLIGSFAPDGQGQQQDDEEQQDGDEHDDDEDNHEDNDVGEGHDDDMDETIFDDGAISMPGQAASITGPFGNASVVDRTYTSGTEAPSNEANPLLFPHGLAYYAPSPFVQHSIVIPRSHRGRSRIENHGKVEAAEEATVRVRNLRRFAGACELPSLLNPVRDSDDEDEDWGTEDNEAEEDEDRTEYKDYGDASDRAQVEEMEARHANDDNDEDLKMPAQTHSSDAEPALEDDGERPTLERKSSTKSRIGRVPSINRKQSSARRIVRRMSSVGVHLFRVKMSPMVITFVLNGQEYIHEGYYSGPVKNHPPNHIMHGNGCFWFTTGDLYLGQFWNGMLHGVGVMSVIIENENGQGGEKKIFKGYFRNNEFVGDERVDPTSDPEG